MQLPFFSVVHSFYVDPGFEMELLCLHPSFNISDSTALLAIKSFGTFVSEKGICHFFGFSKGNFAGSLSLISRCYFLYVSSAWAKVDGRGAAKVIGQWLVFFKRTTIYTVYISAEQIPVCISVYIKQTYSISMYCDLISQESLGRKVFKKSSDEGDDKTRVEE